MMSDIRTLYIFVAIILTAITIISFLVYADIKVKITEEAKAKVGKNAFLLAVATILYIIVEIANALIRV